MTTITNDYRPPSPSPSQLPPVPASPTYSYASTANNHPGGAPSTMNMSSYNLPLPPPPPSMPHAVLTKSDLAASQHAYTELLTTAKAYRIALASLSTAASAFGSALESCARLKEARADSLALGSSSAGPGGIVVVTASSGCTADPLLATAGVHHLVANHEQILSETVYRSFEVPLLHELDKWRRDVEDEEARYLAAVKRQSQDIRRLEKDGLKLHRQKGPRDVAKFRGHLVELTTKLDGLTALHGEHARTLLRESQDTSVKIVEASCSLVRAEVDIFESLARKGWSGGGLEDILEKGQDLFAAEETGTGGIGVGVDEGSTKLFSILPPKSILADTTATTAMAMIGDMTDQFRGRPLGGGAVGGGGYGGVVSGGPPGHRRADSLGVASEPYQSLAGAVTDTRADIDTASIFSADFNSSGRPRMTRPFSPQPVRVRPEDVMGEDNEEDNHHVDDDDDDDDQSDNETEDDGPSSPETIRDNDGRRSVEGFRVSHSDLTLPLGGAEDEHPWGSGKRISSTVSDPDERERRWNASGSDTE